MIQCVHFSSFRAFTLDEFIRLDERVRECGTMFRLQDYSLPHPHWDSTQGHFHVGPAHITHAAVSVTAFVSMVTT